MTVTGPLLVRRWAFVAVGASAAALAVPLHAVASRVSAIVAGFPGLVGLLLLGVIRLAIEPVVPRAGARIAAAAALPVRRRVAIIYVAAIWAHAGADCAIQLIGPLT